MNQRCPREVPVCWAGYGGSNAAPSAPYHIGVKNNGDFRIGQDLGRTGKYSSNGIRNCPLDNESGSCQSWMSVALPAD
jgi:hypothetical protein